MRKPLLLFLCCLLPLFASAQSSPSVATLTQQAIDSLYQYVNATSLTLRALPDASSAATARIAGGSQVLVLRTRADGWSQVQVTDYVGYVKTEYLVDAQQDITADIDWNTIDTDGGLHYTRVAPVPAPAPSLRTATHKPAPKAAAGPKVYICGNGRTEVYHTTESCSAMRRCTYQTLTMSESQARSSGLRGCMKCN